MGRFATVTWNSIGDDMTTIRIYSKDYCPYCKAAKALLSSKGLEFEEIDVQNSPKRFKEMVELSNRRIVPQIFFDQQHIGGYSDLIDYYAELSA